MMSTVPSPRAAWAADIFELYCNGADSADSTATLANDNNGVDSPLPVPTFIGYAPSAFYGDTRKSALLRGMFGRGISSRCVNADCSITSPTDEQGRPLGGPKIRIADVTDGTSNTLLIGETLPSQNEFQRYDGGGGWAMYNNASEQQTIQPINYYINKDDTVGPSPCCTSPTWP